YENHRHRSVVSISNPLTDAFRVFRGFLVQHWGRSTIPKLRVSVGNKPDRNPPFCAHHPTGSKPQAEVRSANERGVKSRMWPEGSNCLRRGCNALGQNP